MSTTATIIIPFEIPSENYSSTFLEAVRGGSAWSREARILLALAAARGLRLDETALILDDARDLRSRQDTLTGAASR
ncbi:MAG TPA: hypothetical protein VF808_04550 [Ktedonobacterales bacterium]